MKKLCMAIVALFGFSSIAMSQGETFKPSGKPFLKIFSNYHSTFTDGEASNVFELQRVYLGYEYTFSENFSAKANFDVGDPGVGKLEMTAYVKNAYVKYKKNNFSVNFGMISTTQFKVQEGFWGYRYLEKSFQDKYKFNASADLGVSAAYKVNDLISADVIIANGEGYKKLESDSALRTGAGLSITPGNFVGRVYVDYSSKDDVGQASLATFIGYANDAFSIGAEYNEMINYDFAEDQHWAGLSFYSTVKICDKLNFLARYDKLFSNTPEGADENWNHSKDGELFIAGVEYSPVKGIKIAPNFSGWKPANGDSFAATAILNLEIKF